MNSNSSCKIHKNIRLKKYDYHTGWFFVTNKANYSKKLFVGKTFELIQEELISISKSTRGVNLDYFMIMPNHIHVILKFDDAELLLSEFWRRFKAITTLRLKRKGIVSTSLWQRNYYEHVIRNEIALHRIRRYIEKNPYEENIQLREIYQDIQREMA